MSEELFIVIVCLGIVIMVWVCMQLFLTLNADDSVDFKPAFDTKTEAKLAQPIRSSDALGVHDSLENKPTTETKAGAQPNRPIKSSGAFEINFEERAARVALIYGLVSGLVFYILYINQVVQESRINQGEEFFVSLIPAAVASAFGLFSGMTIFKAQNLTGHFAMPAIFIIHMLFWSGQRGDDFAHAMFHGVFLLLDLLIVMVLFISFGLAQRWVNQGK